MKQAATIGLSLYTTICAPLAAWYAGWLTALFVVAAALTCGVLIRLPDLAEFAIGPLKTKLEREVREAAATVQQLREFGAAFGQTILAVLAGEGRWGGMGYRAKFAFKAKIDTELRKLGLDEAQMKRAHAVWHQYILYDHGVQIAGLIPQVAKLNSPRLTALLGPDLRTASPSEWREALKAQGLLSLEAEARIADMEHYIQHQTLRRPELWKADDQPAYGAEPSV
jgi:hypothetical protein